MAHVHDHFALPRDRVGQLSKLERPTDLTKNRSAHGRNLAVPAHVGVVDVGSTRRWVTA